MFADYREPPPETEAENESARGAFGTSLDEDDLDDRDNDAHDVEGELDAYRYTASEERGGRSRLGVLRKAWSGGAVEDRDLDRIAGHTPAEALALLQASTKAAAEAAAAAAELAAQQEAASSRCRACYSVTSLIGYAISEHFG